MEHKCGVAPRSRRPGIDRRLLAWGWLSGLIVGGGAYLALLALPSAYVTDAWIQIASFLLGLLQGVRSRSAWWRAVPLGTIGTVASFIVVAGPEANEPVASALRLLAYVMIMNTPGFVAAVVGLLVRIVSERLTGRMRLSHPNDSRASSARSENMS